MKRVARRILYLIGLGVGSVLFGFQLWTGYQAITENSLQLSTAWVLPFIWGISVTAIGLQMFGWSQLMRSLGMPVPSREVITGYSLSFLPRYIPGSFWGYLSRSEWLHESHSVPYRISNLGSFLEIMCILTASGMIWGLYYTMKSAPLIQAISAILTIILPVLIWIILRWGLRRQLFRKVLRNTLIQSDFTISITLWSWLLVVGSFFLLWLCYGTVIWSLVAVTGLPAQGGPIEYSYMFSLAWTVGFFVVFVPAGLGIRELTLSRLLVANTGMTLYQANAISVASRFIISIGELTWVMVGILLSRMSSHKFHPKSANPKSDNPN